MVDGPMVYTQDDGVVVYRASSLGACPNALLAMRMGYDGMSAPEFMQQRYDEGHLHEEPILAKMERQFPDLQISRGEDGSQHQVVLPVIFDHHLFGTVVVKGHLDGFVSKQDELIHTAVVDAKALAKSTFDEWVKKRWDGDLGKKYAWQQSAYMHATGLPLWMAVKHKDSGKHDFTFWDKPMVSVERIRSKVLMIEARAKLNRQPEGPCREPMFPCPVYYLGICRESSAPDSSLVTEDTHLEHLCEAYDSVRAVVSTGEKRKKEIGTEIKDYLGGLEKKETALWKVTEGPGGKSFDTKTFAEDHPNVDLGPYWRPWTKLTVTKKKIKEDG